VTRRMLTATLAAVVVLAARDAAPLAAQAQAAPAVATAPALGAPPKVTMPPVRTTRLANGLELHVVEMREVPLVQLVLQVPAGGRRDARTPGLASFTAGMLDEGAGNLDAFGIAAQAEFLGADLSTAADWDAIAVSMKAPKRNLAAAAELMRTVALRPTFRAAEVARQRDLRLAGILQQRDQPEVVAQLAFNALVFPEGHPYHAPLGGDSASTAALDSAMVRGFYQRWFRPEGARLIVTGDVTVAEARALAQRHFGAWKGTGAAAAAPVKPAAPAFDTTTVYLVDKPGAAQSVLVLGHPGVERSSPDYAALQVMNTILGGSFSSRLNSNLRETKSWTYGARSGFQYRPVPGAFLAQAAVRTDVTDSALVEFGKELRLMRDSLVDPVELARAKQYLALGLAGDFETTTQMAGQVATLVTFGLPMTYYDALVPKIMAVTAEDVRRVARQYVQPSKMSVVVVGDLKTVRPGVEALKLGRSSVRDMYGNEVN